MTPTQAIFACFRYYILVSTRTSRSEFWRFALFVFAGILLFGPMVPVLAALFLLFTFVPILSAMTRRLHDVGRHLGFVLIPTVVCLLSLFIPVFGMIPSLEGISAFFAILAGIFFASSITFLIWHITYPSDPHTNKYGPNPHEVTP
ncbi:MAG: DUF805 domain-containing protein [Paracoccaceae bacterium]